MWKVDEEVSRDEEGGGDSEGVREREASKAQRVRLQLTSPLGGW